MLSFVLAEYGIGNELNSYPNYLRQIHWSPVLIQDSHVGAFVNGNWVGVGGDYFLVNFPFWLLFVAIAVNIYFIYTLQRKSEIKQTPS
jgi:4-hydroxybenzoate polyprenyltransferase